MNSIPPPLFGVEHEVGDRVRIQLVVVVDLYLVRLREERKRLSGRK